MWWDLYQKHLAELLRRNKSFRRVVALTDRGILLKKADDMAGRARHLPHFLGQLDECSWPVRRIIYITNLHYSLILFSPVGTQTEKGLVNCVNSHVPGERNAFTHSAPPGGDQWPSPEEPVMD